MNAHNNKLIFLLSCLFVILTIPAFSQELTLSAPFKVGVGQPFRITFEVNAEASNFTNPTFKGLTVLGGPSTGKSSSVSIINGKVKKSESNSFTFMVRADKEGTCQVGSATCTVNNKRLTSSPATIQVLKSSNAPSHGGAYNQQQQWNQQQQQTARMDANSLFARTTVNKSNPYQGEEVIISYKIYTQLSLRQYQIEKLPGIKGFWSEDLSEGKDIKQYEETVNGRRYWVAEIRRGAIFGQETGKQRIAPLDLNVLAMVPVPRRRTGTIWDLFDDPFFNQAQAVEKPLSTNSVNINVRPLPSVPAGKMFSGGVGSLTAKTSVDQTEVHANEAITFRLTISGHGNLMLIDPPQIDFPKVFEAYDPKVVDKINRGDNGISGSRTFEWVLIPQAQGDYTIPSVEFTYFNPATGHYVTTNSDEIKVKVLKGNGLGKLISGGKSDVELLNNDINHIKPHTSTLRVQGTGVPILPLILMALLLLAAAVIIFLGRRQQALVSDEMSLRQHRALKLARKRLRNAEKHLSDNNDEAFYEEIYKAVWGCLSDRYGIPLAQLSRDTVNECLSSRNIPTEQIQLILHNLDDVDMARFAPGDPSAHKKAIYDETLQTIATL